MFLYQHWFIDGIAVTLFTALVVWIGVTGWRLAREFRARRPNEAWRILGAAGPAAIAILALILTYSTVRLQTQLGAEVAYNSLGQQFTQLETDNYDLRCLYEWPAMNAPAACRARILSNPETFTRTMLYIEETLSILESARVDRAYWGSDYTTNAVGWAEDASIDPTGLISYDIVAENADDPLDAARRSGLTISAQRLCDNYRLVRSELIAAGKQVADDVQWCASHPSTANAS